MAVPLARLSAFSARFMSLSPLGLAMPMGQTWQTSRTLVSSAPRLRNSVENEIYDRTRQQMVLGPTYPRVEPDAFVASNAQCIGNVDVHTKATVWYGAVLRGDESSVVVGPFAHIGEKTVLCTASATPTGLSARCLVGMYTQVGPQCVIKAATLENECVIGQRSIVGEGAVVETHAIVGPGSVVPPGTIVPSGQLWQGNPIEYVRDVTKDEKEDIRIFSRNLAYESSRAHSDELLPFGTQWREAEKLREKLGLKQPTFEIFETPEFELPPPVKAPPASL